jgi:hypothetical protein
MNILRTLHLTHVQNRQKNKIMKRVRDGECPNTHAFIDCLLTTVKELKPFTSQAFRYLKVLVSHFSSTDYK